LHARVGPAQPQGEEPRTPHHRRRAQLAARGLPVQRPEHLPGDRRGRRRRADTRRPRPRLRQETGLRPRRRRGDRARAAHPDAPPHLQRGDPAFRGEGLRHGGGDARGLRPHHALRRLHLGPADHARVPRLLQAGRGRASLRDRPVDARRLAPHQHQRRRPLLHAFGHVRHLSDHRGDAAAPRRMRRPPGGRLPALAGQRDGRHALGGGDPRARERALRASCAPPHVGDRKLPRDFYTRPNVLTVARALLGRLLVVPATDGTRVSGIIVETEAYRGPQDRASHAHGGRRTDRTRTMYAIGGTAYVYFVYGMYHQFNVVTNLADVPHAVL